MTLKVSLERERRRKRGNPPTCWFTVVLCMKRHSWAPMYIQAYVQNTHTHTLSLSLTHTQVALWIGSPAAVLECIQLGVLTCHRHSAYMRLVCVYIHAWKVLKAHTCHEEQRMLVDAHVHGNAWRSHAHAHSESLREHSWGFCPRASACIPVQTWYGHAYTYTNVHELIHNIYIYINTHTHAHTYIHTYIHTYATCIDVPRGHRGLACFSLTMVFGMHTTSLYPRSLHTCARPIPVLPEVASESHVCVRACVSVCKYAYMRVSVCIYIYIYIYIYIHIHACNTYKCMINI